MNSTQRPLSGFEERLLTELRRVVVVERHVLGVREPARPPRFGWSRRVVMAGGVAVVLGVASAAGVPLLVGGEGAPPAYAVTPNGDGTVTVEISSLRDADGLERELREAGVPAAVQYVPAGKACKERTFTPAAASPGSGRMESSVSSTGGGAVRFTIDTGAIVAGQTLVIYTQELRVPSDAPRDQSTGQPPAQGASSVAIAWAQGEVADCEVVDAADGALGPINLPPAAAVESHTASGGEGPVVHSSGTTP
jgi:hypothetical protein